VSRPEVVKVTLVRALPERKHLEITPPQVEGFVFDVRSRVSLNLDSVPFLRVGGDEPNEVIVKP
jgi:type III restriction enzyme